MPSATAGVPDYSGRRGFDGTLAHPVEDFAHRSYADDLECPFTESSMFRLLCCAALFSGFFLLSPALAEDQDVVALERPEPEYPKKAFKRCVEGHVVVRFVITTEGTTKDIQVVSSRPERTFEKAAVAAVEKWRFEPRVINGVAVNREATQRLVFEPGCTR